MKSPRSAVLKTSIMACADILSSFGNLLSSVSDDAFDKLVRAVSRSHPSTLKGQLQIPVRSC
jgi:hypothetical protein